MLVDLGRGRTERLGAGGDGLARRVVRLSHPCETENDDGDGEEPSQKPPTSHRGRLARRYTDRSRPGIRRHISSGDDIPAGEATGLSPPSSQPEPPTRGGPDHMLRLQGQLDERYTAATAESSPHASRPPSAPSETGCSSSGHHYQRDEVIRWADARGDSYRLSVLAQEHDRGRVHRVLRRALHGRVGRRAHRRPPDRDPPRPQRRAAPWPTWPTSTRSRRPGTHCRGHRHRTGHPDHLHELLGRPEGVRGPQRRCRLHLHQRPSRARLGARQGHRAGLASVGATGGGDKVLFFPDQHLGRNTGLGDGLRARRHAGVEPAARARWAHRGGVQGGHPSPVEGPLLGAPAVPARPRRGLPSGAPRRHRRDAPRVPLRHLPDGRPRRLHRLHHPHGERGAGRLRDRRGHRDPPREPA